MYTCLLDTWADRIIIPESQAQGLDAGETVDLHAAGHSFQGKAANLKVHVGPVTTCDRGTAMEMSDGLEEVAEEMEHIITASRSESGHWVENTCSSG